MAKLKMPTKNAFDHGHVFLSETEHHGSGIDDSGDLRARIVQNALFAGCLVVTDSQVLNNAALRPLFGEHQDVQDPSYLADLAALVDAGLLVVARRDSVDSLREIRDGHAQRDVEGVPSEQYADMLDEITEGHQVLFSESKVSGQFKRKVVDRLTDFVGSQDGHARRDLYTAMTWIKSQDPLYYNSLRRWSKCYASTHEAASEEALEMVERVTEWAFRTAVPGALEIPIAWGSVNTPTTVAIRGDVHRDDELMPSWELSPVVLKRLPAEIVRESVGLESRRAVVEGFARAHSHRQVDEEELKKNTRSYLRNLQAAARAVSRGDDEEALNAVRDVPARLHISTSTVAGASAGTAVALIADGLNPRSLLLNLASLPASALADIFTDRGDRASSRERRWLEAESNLPEGSELRLLRIVSREEPL